jgi:hypothetical protein
MLFQAATLSVAFPDGDKFKRLAHAVLNNE